MATTLNQPHGIPAGVVADSTRRKTGKIALSLGLLAAAAPLLLSSSPEGSAHFLSSSSRRARILEAGSVQCPPGTIQGLNPKEGGDLGTECVSATRIDEDENGDGGTCLNSLPYGILHDSRPEEIQSYQSYHIKMAGGPRAASWGYDGGPPKLATLPPGSSFANWDCRRQKDKCLDGKVSGINKVKGSAWTADGTDAFGPSQRWAPHEQYLAARSQKSTILTGVDVVAHTGFFPNNFGHILHDNLPAVAWLKYSVHDETTFLLPDHDNFRKLVLFIDPEFNKRVYWYQPNEVITIQDGTLTVSDQWPFLGPYGNTLWRYLRRWIGETHPERFSEEEKTVVYYARGSIPPEEDAIAEERRLGAQTRHGRLLDPRHELDVVSSIRAAMDRHGRKEKLVFFTGSDERTGKVLPFEEQFDIFRRASAVIGPHGSGLANVIWTDPFPPSCDDRVKILEFIPGSDSAQVQVLYNGYYWTMRGMPLEWHQITYAPNSTQEVTSVRLPDLKRALDDMWGPNS